ncbi:MAG TPA: TonB-dependent receptor, partial [Candidatus Ozemobacteraceae bacterium]|nr:TonB-dependent receptor [Candidatus Ozemobacteraceae bacterium]
VRFICGWHSSDTALDTFSPVTSAPVDDPDFTQHRSEATANLHATHPLPDGEWQFSAARRDAVISGSDPTEPWNDYDMHAVTHQQSFDRFWFTSKGELDLGVSHQETKAANAGILKRDETDDALRGGISWSPAAGWHVRSISRVDRYSNPDDSAATGKLALSREFGRQSVEASWGNSFRRPSLNERFYPNYGDENLAPETGRTLSLAVAHHLGKSGKIEARSYRTRADNLIGTVATTDPAYAWGFKAANMETAEIAGHEISAHFSRHRCRMDLEYSRTPRARILNTGNTLPRVPEHAVALSISHSVGNGEVYLRHARWGATWDDANNTRCVAPTNRSDLGYTSRHRGGTLRLALLNLANNRSQRIFGYGEPGRRLAASWEIDL